jgi:hypothetical protein
MSAQSRVIRLGCAISTYVSRRTTHSTHKDRDLHLELYTASPEKLQCGAMPELSVQQINFGPNIRNGTNASNLGHSRIIYTVLSLLK